MSRVICCDNAQDIFEAIERTEALAAATMPDTVAALSTLNKATYRLQKLGWLKGVYCPKDGSNFAVIQYGSTGIFAGTYVGDWPTGDVWIADETCAPQGIMWKPLDKLTAAESERLDACIADHRGYIDRLGKSFAAVTTAPGGTPATGD